MMARVENGIMWWREEKKSYGASGVVARRKLSEVANNNALSANEHRMWHLTALKWVVLCGFSRSFVAQNGIT